MSESEKDVHDAADRVVADLQDKVHQFLHAGADAVVAVIDDVQNPLLLGFVLSGMQYVGHFAAGRADVLAYLEKLGFESLRAGRLMDAIITQAVNYAPGKGCRVKLGAMKKEAAPRVG